MPEGRSVRLRVAGRGGEKCMGEVGVCAHSSDEVLVPPPAWLVEAVAGEVLMTVPKLGSGAIRVLDGGFMMPSASLTMECRRRNCEEMKDAEWRSPVQRVMSMQSRDWLRSPRRWERVGRGRGLCGSRERLRGGSVLRRRWSVCEKGL